MWNHSHKLFYKNSHSRAQHCRDSFPHCHWKEYNFNDNSNIFSKSFTTQFIAITVTHITTTIRMIRVSVLGDIFLDKICIKVLIVHIIMILYFLESSHYLLSESQFKAATNALKVLRINSNTTREIDRSKIQSELLKEGLLLSIRQLFTSSGIKLLITDKSTLWSIFSLIEISFIILFWWELWYFGISKGWGDFMDMYGLNSVGVYMKSTL